MFNKEYTAKAVNIIRPSSPYIIQESYHSSSTSSLSHYNPIKSNLQHNPWPSINPTNTVGVNPHRFLQRPRSDSNLSTRSTFFSNLSLSSFDESSSSYDDLDSIDGLTDEEDLEDLDEEDEEEVTENKVVAKMIHGTIMNGKGEFLNKGGVEDTTWLDEARANRKIADLEIEKESLLMLNNIMEAKLRQQTEVIIQLQNRLIMNDKLLSTQAEVILSLDESDDDEEEEDEDLDPVYDRVQLMVDSLISAAESALSHKIKQSGRVLQDYNYDKHREDTLRKLTVAPDQSKTLKRSTRRISDTSPKSTPKINRNISRQSAPPAMINTRSISPNSSSTIYPRSASPSNQSPFSYQRSTSPRQSSQLRRSQESDKPKWHF